MEWPTDGVADPPVSDSHQSRVPQRTQSTDGVPDARLLPGPAVTRGE